MNAPGHPSRFPVNSIGASPEQPSHVHCHPAAEPKKSHEAPAEDESSAVRELPLPAVREAAAECESFAM